MTLTLKQSLCQTQDLGADNQVLGKLLLSKISKRTNDLLGGFKSRLDKMMTASGLAFERFEDELAIHFTDTTENLNLLMERIDQYSTAIIDSHLRIRSLEREMHGARQSNLTHQVDTI